MTLVLQDLIWLILGHLLLALFAIVSVFKTEKSSFMKLVWSLVILSIPYLFGLLYFLKSSIEKRTSTNDTR